VSRSASLLRINQLRVTDPRSAGKNSLFSPRNDALRADYSPLREHNDSLCGRNALLSVRNASLCARNDRLRVRNGLVATHNDPLSSRNGLLPARNTSLSTCNDALPLVSVAWRCARRRGFRSAKTATTGRGGTGRAATSSARFGAGATNNVALAPLVSVA